MKATPTRSKSSSVLVLTGLQYCVSLAHIISWLFATVITCGKKAVTAVLSGHDKQHMCCTMIRRQQDVKKVLLNT